MSVKTRAFVNFYAAIGAVSKFAELDPKAKEIASEKNISVRFEVKDGPDGLLSFKDGKVTAEPYAGEKCDIRLLFQNRKLSTTSWTERKGLRPFRSRAF
jgi:hypothetical protein